MKEGLTQNPHRKMWENLIERNKEGSLEPDDVKALNIRTKTIEGIKDFAILTGMNPVSAEEFRSSQKSYELHKQELLKMGIEKHMHREKHQSFFSYPLRLVEYVAGQLLTVENEVFSSREGKNNCGLLKILFDRTTFFLAPEIESPQTYWGLYHNYFTH